MVRRDEAIQGLLDLFDQPSYLEIGVNAGLTFHGVRAAQKVAVDPAFTFDHELEASRRPDSRYHQVESDTYFLTLARREDVFDVVYLDGLHTYEQTLRDLLNTLQHLHAKSVVVIDDVLPSDYASSIGDPHRMNAFRAAVGDTGAAWMGDVYKLVFFINSFLPQFSFATIADNHGQAVLWREPRQVSSPQSTSEIASMDFADLVLKRPSLNVLAYDAIVNRVRQSRMI